MGIGSGQSLHNNFFLIVLNDIRVFWEDFFVFPLFELIYNNYNYGHQSHTPNGASNNQPNWHLVTCFTIVHSGVICQLSVIVVCTNAT